MRRNRITSTTIEINQSMEGETIEQKIQRIVNNKEPITDGAPVQYTERKDGVRPEYDIRTDRWDLAVEAMDKVSKQKIAKRMEVIKGGTEEKPQENLEGRQGEETATK